MTSIKRDLKSEEEPVKEAKDDHEELMRKASAKIDLMSYANR